MIEDRKELHCMIYGGLLAIQQSLDSLIVQAINMNNH